MVITVTLWETGSYFITDSFVSLGWIGVSQSHVLVNIKFGVALLKQKLYKILSLRMVLGWVFSPPVQGRTFLITKSVSTEETNPSIEKFNNKLYIPLVPKIVPSQFPCPIYGLKTFMLPLQIYHLKTFSLCYL